jgi:hypothetical protein
VLLSDDAHAALDRSIKPVKFVLLKVSIFQHTVKILTYHASVPSYARLHSQFFIQPRSYVLLGSISSNPLA